MAKIGAVPLAEQNAVMLKQASAPDLTGLGPARGAVGRDLLDLAGAPYRHGDSHDDGGDTAGGRDIGAFDEDFMRVSVVGEPPPEERGRLIDRPAEQHEPRLSELRLKGEMPSCPFRRRPDEGEHHGADGEDLAPEDLGRVHGDESSTTL